MRPLKLAGVTAATLAALLLALNAHVPSHALASGAVLEGRDIPEARIAVCALVAITDELMSSDRFRPDAEDNLERLREEHIRPIFEEGKALEQQLKDADPNDPANNERKKRLLELRDILLPQAQQMVGIEQEKYVANRFAEAYALAASSARAIATDLGFNYVLATITPDDEFAKDTPMAAVRNAILGRPVVMMPDGVDISDAVRDDLKLE